MSEQARLRYRLSERFALFGDIRVGQRQLADQAATPVPVDSNMARVMPAADVAPALTPDDRFLAARPVEAHDEHEDPPSDAGPSGGSGSTHTVSRSGAGWCVEDTWWGGDEGWRTACLDDRGPLAGAAGFAGGSTHEIRFERIEP